MEHFYRTTAVQYASPLDEFGDSYGIGRTEICMTAYEVIKHTPKGVWISYWGTKKFIKTDVKKQYASRTAEEATKHFIARKKAQIRILEGQLERAKNQLNMASNIDSNKLKPIISPWYSNDE